MPVSLLFVCTGNICRSPTAHGVMQKKVFEAGLGRQILVDSAGTSRSHGGEAPDRRAISAAKKRGYDLANLRSRPILQTDYSKFDLILAMDEGHVEVLARTRGSPAGAKVQLLMEYAPGLGRIVPDPYYAGLAHFEKALDLIEPACDGLLAAMRAKIER